MERIIGQVIKGKQFGRTLGYPTINVTLRKPIPFGVYAGKVILEDGEYQAALFVGKDDLVEAHIIDFSGDLYHKKVVIQIEKKLRAVRSFANEAALKEQIKQDISSVRNNP